jgi:hypothetical protein
MKDRTYFLVDAETDELYDEAERTPLEILQMLAKVLGYDLVKR